MERQVGSGGSSGVNYITNGNFETDASGWTTFAEGGTTYVDGTGGSPTATITRTTVTPLVAPASGLYTAGAVGNGVSFDTSIDVADRGRPMLATFLAQPDADMADGDYEV